MVDLAQLSQSNSYAQTSGPGFGTRMLCRRLTEHGNAPVNTSMWLTGLRRANALSMNTNDIPNAHMRSPGGFIEFFAGLTDPGDIQFEACWKNDAPTGITAWDDEDFQRWQAPREADTDANKGFFHSIFYDRQPFEAWVVPPQWTRGLILVRGYAKMVGPFPHEMEGVINFQGAFKASGKPMLLRGEKVMAAGITIPAANTNPVRYRAVSNNFLQEFWTDLVEPAGSIDWAESHVVAVDGFKYYKYTEDAGFGTAF